MSQENVDLTRRAFKAFDDRDLDALLAILDDDVEAVPILAAMEGGYRGHDGIRRWWASLLGTFPDFHAEICELRDLGDVTFAVLRLQGRGAGSDTPVDAAAWQITQFRESKCIGWRVYTSEHEALEAVGLSDQPMARKNVDIVRRMVELWNAGDGDEWLSAFHSDVEFVDHQAAIGMRDRGRGLNELQRAVAQWTEIFDDFRIDVLELVDLRSDYVIGHTRFEGVGHDSGISVSHTQIDLYRVVDSKIVEYHAGFESRAEALEAVGLDR